MLTRTYSISEEVYYKPYKSNISYKCVILDILMDKYYVIKYIDTNEIDRVYPSNLYRKAISPIKIKQKGN